MQTNKGFIVVLGVLSAIVYNENFHTDCAPCPLGESTVKLAKANGLSVGYISQKVGHRPIFSLPGSFGQGVAKGGSSIVHGA